MDNVVTVNVRPAVLHTVVIAVFASLIAPFGGFFASGLKRAFKIKVGRRLHSEARVLEDESQMIEREREERQTDRETEREREKGRERERKGERETLTSQTHTLFLAHLQDFDNLIPGHGGVTDRFDCQLFMAFFFFVYFHTFIKVCVCVCVCVLL